MPYNNVKGSQKSRGRLSSGENMLLGFWDFPKSEDFWQSILLIGHWSPVNNINPWLYSEYQLLASHSQTNIRCESLNIMKDSIY